MRKLNRNVKIQSCDILVKFQHENGNCNITGLQKLDLK